MEKEINGKIYELVDQTKKEVNDNGACGGCIGKDQNFKLCVKLGTCWDGNINKKWILKQ